jgi:YVTN family beta-propeller protein
VGGDPEGISSDGTDVWVTNFDGDAVTELDASTGAVVQTIAVGKHPVGISSDGTDVWVANSHSNTVSEIDIAATPPPSPTITKFSPASGPVGTVVTIKGTNLSGATKVTFDGVKGTITKDTAREIKVKVPSGAKTGKIEVVTPGGKVKTATAFTVT